MRDSYTNMLSVAKSVFQANGSEESKSNLVAAMNSCETALKQLLMVLRGNSDATSGSSDPGSPIISAKASKRVLKKELSSRDPTSVFKVLSHSEAYHRLYLILLNLIHLKYS